MGRPVIKTIFEKERNRCAITLSIESLEEEKEYFHIFACYYYYIILSKKSINKLLYILYYWQWTSIVMAHMR